jgi:hypothetical protein
MVVVALTLGAAVGLFNSMNKLSRVQLHTAEMQQSVRVAQREVGRLVQMAGRGGLAGENNVGAAFDTPAVSVRDNVGAAPFDDREVAPADADSPLAVAGTDILTIRGAFDSSVFHINYADRTNFDGAGRRVVLGSRTPTGIPQDLRPIKWACDPPDGGSARPEALVLINAVNEESYAVVELDCNNTDHASIPDPFVPGALPTSHTIAFFLAGDGGDVHADDYARLNPNGGNPDITGNFNPSFLALIEEYRFYVREQCRTLDGGEADCTDAGPPAPLPAHRLSMARMFPGTDVPWADDDNNFSLDLSDSIFELQVALGFDSSYDGAASSNGFFTFDADNLPGTGVSGDNDSIVETADGTGDDWLFNGVSDDASHFNALPWTPTGAPPAFTADQPQPRLYYLRLSTLGFTARPDRGYSAPLINRIENHDLTSSDLINGDLSRPYRRELLQTVIDMRNLG